MRLAMIAVILAGCAAPPRLVEAPIAASGHRIMIVDDAFTDAERQKIVGELWRVEQERPGLTFGVMASSEAFVYGAPPLAISIVAVHETSCTHTKIAFGCWVPPGRIEFAPGTINEMGKWTDVIDEELSHALGFRDVSHSP